MLYFAHRRRAGLPLSIITPVHRYLALGCLHEAWTKNRSEREGLGRRPTGIQCPDWMGGTVPLALLRPRVRSAGDGCAPGTPIGAPVGCVDRPTWARVRALPAFGLLPRRPVCHVCRRSPRLESGLLGSHGDSQPCAADLASRIAVVATPAAYPTAATALLARSVSSSAAADQTSI